ncbi:FAD-dependent oxidoreductase [Kitasatospora sp. NPDC059327]|uniref:FAD-dependent oxidoreductase n=1 Tax=Kitasatospora sp. NPDC059327 TaxID=3346803 RepID=UPI0036C95884
MPNHRVIIVGAGLGGLTLAQGLRTRGFDVTVHERDPHPDARPQGYRIQLDRPGLTGLRRCLPESLFRLCLATAGSPPARVSVRGRHLQPLTDRAAEETPGPDTTDQDLQRPHAFDRPTLRRILLSGLDDRVHYGAELIGFEQAADSTVTARFTDGRTATGDLLVGADGVGSAVRALLLPNARVEDAGLRLIYGRIRLDRTTPAEIPPWVFDSIFTVVTGGPGHPHVGLGPVRFGCPPDTAGAATDPPVALPATGDYLACMVGAPADHPALRPFAELRRLDRGALRDLALTVLGDDWHPDVHRLLSRWETDSLFPLRVSTAAPVEPWEAGRVTLIGDAIHAMSPVLAMGANTAIRDAGELVAALSAAADEGAPLVEAVRDYQNRMVDYAFAVVASSRRTGRERVGQK